MFTRRCTAGTLVAVTVLLLTVASVNVAPAAPALPDPGPVRAAADTPTTTTVPGYTATPVAAGGSWSSDAANFVPTAAKPFTATVTSPVAGLISFVKNAGTSTAGYKPISGAAITAPTASAAQPLQIVFKQETSSLPAGLPLGAVSVLIEGAEVADCTSQVAATPDPCVLSRVRAGNVLTITVLSSHASNWTLATQRVRRFFGDNRVASAIAVSRATFADGQAGAVVLARADGFADALAATPLAVANNAPLLLTGSGTLDDAVLLEITRALPVGKRVFLLGGVKALSQEVENRLIAWGYAPKRVYGDTRYDTAVAVAGQFAAPKLIVETTGLSFADALSAGAIAARNQGVVLLTAGARQADATAAYIAAHPKIARVALGGPAAKADPGATAIVGDDRYETAVLAAVQYFPQPDIVGVTTGTSFADALAGGTQTAMAGGPLLLLPPTGKALPTSMTIYLRNMRGKLPIAFVYGGTKAVGDDIAGALRVALGD